MVDHGVSPFATKPSSGKAVDSAATVEAVGEFALKGIHRPLAAHKVLPLSQQARKRAKRQVQGRILAIGDPIIAAVPERRA